MISPPITLDSFIKHLKTFEFLNGLDNKTLSTLAKSTVWKVFTPDSVVFWEGDTETNLDSLQNGSLIEIGCSN